MLSLLRGKKITVVLFVLFFFGLNWFVVLPVYGLPSTTCRSAIYHTYACDGDTRYYCVRSESTNSSGVTTYTYWWQLDDCGTNQRCSSGTCICDIGYNTLNTSTCNSNCWCGAAASGSYSSAPTSNLCLAGNNYGVSLYMSSPGVFYWQWVCDANGTNCSTKNYCAAVATGGWGIECYKDSDCGTCTRCINDGAWNAYCESSRYYNSGTNGVCGGSNNQTVCSTALSATCTSGNPTTPTLSGSTYLWKCNGIPATTCAATVTNDDCSATKAADTNGADGACIATTTASSYCAYANIPGASRCVKNGTYSASATVDNLTEGIKWTCAGTDDGKTCSGVTGQAKTCTAKKTTPVKGDKGVCKASVTSGSYCWWDALPAAKCDNDDTPRFISDSSTTMQIKWWCDGNTNNQVCGGGAGDNTECTATKLSVIQPTDGVCSAAINGQVVQVLPPANTRCSAGTQANFAGTVNYTWSCLGIAGQCARAALNDTTCWATLDTAPTLSSTVLKNTSGTVIAVEAGGRNHSCDANFAGSKTSVWTITAADANGVADIGTMSLSFRSTGNTYNTSAVSSSGGVANFTVDTTSFAPGTYRVWVLINDIHNPPGNRDWIDTNRDFKIWDCEVIVDGRLYDNSENLSCVNGSNQGFDQPIDGGLSFVFDYLDKTDGSTRDMTVVSPRFYSPKTMTWQNTYTLTNNTTANYLGVFNRLKINDVCIVPVNTDIIPRSYVDPYSASPTINIKYSAIMDQDAWYQVLNGGVFTKTNITNYIPVTCVSNCKTAIGGLIWSKDVDLSGKDTGTTAALVLKRPINYDYEELKYDIYGGKEVGTTIAITETTVLWSQINTNKGVIFIDRDFTIDSNIVPTSEPTLIVVKGDIIVEDNVTQINGMLFADGTIQASGENDTQLTITGALYSKGGVVLDRSYATKRTNNTLPSVKITYDPNLVFNLDPKLWYLYDNWTLE